MSANNLVMSWNEALEHYNLNYNVEKRPVKAMLGDDQEQVIPNLYSVVRTDTGKPLSGVGVNGRYECIQTSSYADIGNRICGELGAEFVKGGTLCHGRGLFMQAKLPDSIRVRGTDDVIDKLLTFITSHDGSLAFMIVPTGLRLFCENQFKMLNQDVRDYGVKIRHTNSAVDRLKEADQAILATLNAYRAMELKVNQLAESRFTDTMMTLAARKLFNVKEDMPENEIKPRTRNNMTKVQELFTQGRGQHMFQGTAWAAYNAMTEYADHERSVRKDTNRFEAGLIGSGAMLKDKALKIVNSVLANSDCEVSSVHPS